MSSTGDDLAENADVTGAMKKLGEGKSREEAARVIWEYSYIRLVRMARAMLGTVPRAVRDEEDLALTSIKSFCAGAARGLFPDLTSRDNLWRILHTITLRKANAMKLHERSQKRDARRVAHLDVDQLADPEPTPELATLMVDQRAALIEHLRDDTLRRIAEMHLDGLSSTEIARELAVSDRTIQRKLDLIRKAWQRELTP
jgi:DNA-directed RNA polymerase specialized sigma24 family protein